MYYILLYDVVDDYINRRAPFRDEHLRVATEAVEKGQVVEEFVKNDPYVKNDLITNWKIREWTVVIGSAMCED